MAAKTFTVLAASYDTLGAAEADFDAGRDFYLRSGLIDAYDAAVITRAETGKVKIVVQAEQATRPGAWGGLGIGLAGGALVALFPAVGIGADLLLESAGASLGALAGRVSAGLTRADLKDLGELLDQGQSGLVIVAASDLGDRLQRVTRRARTLTEKWLTVDERAIEQDIEAAARLHDRTHEQAVAGAEAAVAEAEAEAKAAERAAERYSAGTRHRGGDDLASQLQDLSRLRQTGVLSAREFEAAKSALLGGRSG